MWDWRVERWALTGLMFLHVRSSWNTEVSEVRGCRVQRKNTTITYQRVGGRRACCEAFGVGRGGARSGADLGYSSRYSSENLEDRSGAGFHVNST